MCGGAVMLGEDGENGMPGEQCFEKLENVEDVEKTGDGGLGRTLCRQRGKFLGLKGRASGKEAGNRGKL